jgi:hypothetical protein
MRTKITMRSVVVSICNSAFCISRALYDTLQPQLTFRSPSRSFISVEASLAPALQPSYDVAIIGKLIAGLRHLQKKVGRFVGSLHRLIPSRTVSLRRRCASGRLLLRRLLAAQATEAPLPADPRTEASAIQSDHPEIRARRGLRASCLY